MSCPRQWLSDRAGGARSRASVCPQEQTLAGFLDGDLAGPPRDQVLEHLHGCESCRRLVAALAGGEADPTRTPLVPGGMLEPDLPPLGTRIGRFEVRGSLGRGGMGVVLRAFDPALGREVALKLVESGSRSTPAAALRARQLREAQALARVSHPNVVEIFDAGIWQGRVFMAMELVRGRTLRQWANDAKRTISELIEVLCEAGRGLAAVHAAGLVHRDFKPDNVLVSDASPSGTGVRRVVVADFGLVCLDRVASTDDHNRASPRTELSVPLTQAGEVVGTPAYMAPEQHDDALVDPRTDQFAFCVTAYEVLYGARPFRGGSMAELRAAITRRVVRRRRPGIPRRIERALLRGLSENPAQRFASMQPLLDTLAVGRSRWPRRVALGCVVAISLAAALSLPAVAEQGCPQEDMNEVWPGQAGALRAKWSGAQQDVDLARTEEALDRYAVRWREAWRDACDVRRSRPHVADATMQCLRSQRDSVAALIEVLLHDTQASLGRAAMAVPTPSGCDGGQSPLAMSDDPAQAELRRAMAHLHVASYDEASRAATAVLARADLQPQTRARALRIRGIAARAHGQLPTAQAEFQASFFEARRAGDEQTTLQVGMELATLLGEEMGRIDEGLRWYDHAVKASPAALRELSRFAALSADTHGLLLRTKGDLPGAEAQLRDAVRIAEQSDDVRDTNRAIYVSHLATVLAMQEEHDEAGPLFEQAVALMSEHAGPMHPQVGMDRLNLGSVLLAQGRLGEAKQHYDDAIAIFGHTHGEDHPLMAQALANVGLLARLQGEHEAALSKLSEAAEHFARVYGPDHPMVAKTHQLMAEVHLSRGDTRAAIQTASSVVASLQTSGGDPESLGRAHMDVGLSRWLQGEHGAAVTSLRQARDILGDHFGDDHGLVARVGGRLCMALSDVGELDAARQVCDEAVASADASSERPGAEDGRDGPHVAEQYRARAYALLLQGDLQAARRDLEAFGEVPDDGTDPGLQAHVRRKLGAALQRAGLSDLAAAQHRIADALVAEAAVAWKTPGLATPQPPDRGSP